MLGWTKVFDILPGWLWALALTGALGLAWWQYDAKRDLVVELAKVDKALADQKIQAGKTLLTETQRANDAELKLQKALGESERLSAKNTEVSGAYYRTLADLARAESGRLRDPAATGCRCSSDKPQTAGAPSAVNSGGDGTATGGLLSESLSGLLQSEAKANDRINDAYAACRADSLKLRTIIDEYNRAN